MVCLRRGYSVLWMIGVLGAVASGPGCGLDLASGDSETATDSTGNGVDTDDGSDADDTDEGGGDTDGPTSPDTSGDPTGSGGSTGGEDSGTSEDTCDALGCSGAGYCELDAEGPVCVCDSGFASTGLDCLPCEPVQAGMLPANVPAVRAQFNFTLNGQDAPSSGLHFGRITLRNRASGDLVTVGRTNASATLLMVPGVYDVLYEFREGDDFPLNRSAVLKQIEVREDNAIVDVDVAPLVVRGAISFPEGSAPASPGLNYGQLWLVDPRTDDRILLGTTKDDTYDTLVVPGAYEIHYEYRESDGEAPINADGFVQDLEVFDPADAVRDIVIPVARLHGSVRVDGQFVGSGLDYGQLELRDTTTGDTFRLGDSNDESYELTILPGRYEVVYSAREFGALTPVNQNVVVQTLDIVSGDNDISLDLQTSVVRGEFSVNTSAPPSADFDDGIVTLEGPSGDPVVLGNTRFGTYERRILDGTYSVYYSQETASQTMPVNTHAQLGKPVTVSDDQELDIDIGVVEVVGTMTIDGVPAPDSAYDDGRLFLRDPESGDSVLLGNTREGNYAARLVPGTYDIVYSNEFSDTLLPVNQGAVLSAGVEVTGGDALNIDVPVTTMVGSVGIEGSRPKTAEGIGTLFLRDVETDDRVFIGDTNAVDFTRPLTSGTYIMEYRGTPAVGATLGTSLPANESAAFACYEIVSD
ncbi:MAG: hypothetical protein ACRBN8_00550 [Nannocystales bacterium]